jgi:hypothetical protein
MLGKPIPNRRNNAVARSLHSHDPTEVGKVVIVSAGRDRRFGTADDARSGEL